VKASSVHPAWTSSTVPDIDDKIIKRANENGEDFVALVDRMVAEMHNDFDALNILRPESEPRATQHIPEIIEIVEQLIARGHAYVAGNGDVMFGSFRVSVW